VNTTVESGTETIPDELMSWNGYAYTATVSQTQSS
jgi:hypothetical protein